MTGDYRFEVTYRITAGDRDDAEGRAAAIALEDTVEIPRDVVPGGYIEDVVLGRVREVSEAGEGVFHARLGFHIDAVGDAFPQFLNVVMGNASILAGVKVISIAPNADVLARFPGPRFGIDGTRTRTGRGAGGLVCPVIKPQGSSSRTLADLAYRTARAGADIVKEDHGLANQAAAPFRERVRLGAAAVARANAERAEAGDATRALYFASLCGHGDELRDRALFAQEAGAGGVLVMPGLMGFDAVNRLAQDPAFDLPIMAHPSHLGPYVLSPDQGYGHGVLFGTLMRLAGADISVFPNFGGRFGFSLAECREIAGACRDAGPGRPILPSPGGGMKLERMAELRAVYGDDSVYLLGGDLLRLGDRIGEGIRAMRAALGR